jgi:hypothetical protein
MEYAGIGLIALVVGLSEVIKKTGFNSKLIPIVNLILGLGAGIIFLNPGDLKAGIIQGIFIGLSASGLYSGVKNVSEEIKG